MFSAIAILTLAIGIGANTAIFSVVQGILLKPLPYPRSDELVTIDHSAPGINLPSAGAAPFLYFTYREQGRTFQDVGLWNTGTVSVTGLAEPEEVPTLFVTDAVLPILGVQPRLGRLFSRSDAAPGGPETVILTSGYWQSKFGGESSRHRPDADARQQTARSDRRAPGALSIPRSPRVARRPLPARSQQDVSRAVQLQRRRAAETRRDLRAGPGGRRPADSDLVHPVSAVCGDEREDVRGSAAHAAGALAERRPRRRHQAGHLGADGDDRPGAAGRLRERGEPAAGAGRIAAAGAGGAGGPRRGHERHRARAAARKPRPGACRRRGRPRARLRRASAAVGARARQPAADRGHRPRRHGARLHAGRVGSLGPGVRIDPGAQVRAHSARRHAARRQPHGQREQEPAPSAQHAGRGAGRRRARAAGQLRADDQNLSGPEGRASGVRAGAGGPDRAPVDSRLPDQGSGSGCPDAPGHRRKDGRGALAFHRSRSHPP